jgi:hypothetical protein
MRLLDQVAASTQPLCVAQHDGAVLTLTGAATFAHAISRCPLRYVLSDFVTQNCASLAYSDGMTLAQCFDLLRLPAEKFWIEWRDLPRQQELERCFESMRHRDPVPEGLQAGAWVQSDVSGRSGTLRTFWASAETNGDPQVSPLITYFDFDAPQPQPRSMDALFDGEAIALDVAGEPAVSLSAAEAGMSTLLAFMRFRLDKTWLDYYRRYARSVEARREVLIRNLSTVATDLPVVIAFAMLLNARGGVDLRQSDLARLNRARRRNGKPPLLDHIEVGMRLTAGESTQQRAAVWSGRRAPRFHHVRGHLVRRADQVFWRSPHWRGELRLGQIRSRTVNVHA